MNLIKPLYAMCNPLLESGTCGKIAKQPINYTNSVIQTIMTIFITIGIIYFIWHVVMSAYHMISSQGDPKKWEQAQKSLLYSIVGIIVVLSIFTILKFVGIVFGIDALSTLTITWPTIKIPE